MPRIERIRMLIGRQKFFYLTSVGQFDIAGDMRNEESILANHLREKDARIFADAISNQMIVESFLRIAGPTHDPAHIARGEGISVLGTEIAGRVEGSVGDHHLHRHAAAGDRRIQFVGELHTHSRTAGEHASTAGGSTVRDAQLGVLAVGHNVFGIEFAVRDHLCEGHHRRGIRTNRVRGNYVDICILGSLRRGNAAIDSDCSLLLYFRCLHNHSALNVFRPPVAQVSQFLRLSSMQSGRDGECCIHAHDAGIEIEFRYTFQASGRTLLDADAATFAVVDENLVHAVGTLGTRDARFRANQVAVVTSITSPATETTPGLFDCLFFRERLNHFFLRLFPAGGSQHDLVEAREVREIRHVHSVEIEDDVDGDGARLQLLAAHYLVEIEGNTFAISNGIDHHQRLTGTELSDVARREEVGVAQAAEPVDLDGATLVLELGRQPTDGGALANGDDDVVHVEVLAGDLSIDGDGRCIDGPGKARG